jgi:hypothetical protein
VGPVPWRRPDLWAGLLVAAAAATLFVLTGAIRETEEGIVGARFVPRVVCGLLILGGLVLAAGTLRRPDGGRAAADDGEDDGPPSVARALALPGLGLLYVAAIPWIGYIAATLPAAMAALRLLGMRGAARTALVAAALTALSWLAFAQGMGLFLPRGRLLDLAAFLPS